MIDMSCESLITLREAARLVPRRKGKTGQTVTTQTVTSWITRGKNGVRLEALSDPTGWYTSLQAVQRFLEALAARRVKPEPPKPVRKSWAKEYLQAEGVLPKDVAS